MDVNGAWQWDVRGQGYLDVTDRLRSAWKAASSIPR